MVSFIVSGPPGHLNRGYLSATAKQTSDLRRASVGIGTVDIALHIIINRIIWSLIQTNNAGKKSVNDALSDHKNKIRENMRTGRYVNKKSH